MNYFDNPTADAAPVTNAPDDFLARLQAMVGQPVTLYSPSGMGFGFVPVEVKLLAVEIKPWAQYKNALALHYLEKGKRKPRGVVLSSLVQTAQLRLLATDLGIPVVEIRGEA